jgi:hypothetical protein
MLTVVDPLVSYMDLYSSGSATFLSSFVLVNSLVPFPRLEDSTTGFLSSHRVPTRDSSATLLVIQSITKLHLQG